jgi:hypothetical protein
MHLLITERLYTALRGWRPISAALPLPHSIHLVLGRKTSLSPHQARRLSRQPRKYRKKNIECQPDSRVEIIVLRFFSRVCSALSNLFRMPSFESLVSAAHFMRQQLYK